MVGLDIDVDADGAELELVTAGVGAGLCVDAVVGRGVGHGLDVGGQKKKAPEGAWS